MIEETYALKAIVINRKPFRENDLLVTIYSPEQGKQSLVARGARKFRSKVAAHIEPLSFIDGLVVRGKSFDYLGSALCAGSLFGIKSDYGNLESAGRIVRIFDRLVKDGQPDHQAFAMLRDILLLINGSVDDVQVAVWADLFIIKLLSQLGIGSELHDCVICGQKIRSNEHSFDLYKNGLVCHSCNDQKTGLIISDNVVKMLRLATKIEVKDFCKISINHNLADEIAFFVSQIVNHHH
ncbi:DNA repair protein RecO [Candidatus Falkowbacteria bacterium]|nr:DNA repair protein RecO [Candidatus Falkowbacteria bacterium]